MRTSCHSTRTGIFQVPLSYLSILRNCQALRYFPRMRLMSTFYCISKKRIENMNISEYRSSYLPVNKHIENASCCAKYTHSIFVFQRLITEKLVYLYRKDKSVNFRLKLLYLFHIEICSVFI